MRTYVPGPLSVYCKIGRWSDSIGQYILLYDEKKQLLYKKYNGFDMPEPFMMLKKEELRSYSTREKWLEVNSKINLDIIKSLILSNKESYIIAF